MGAALANTCIAIACGVGLSLLLKASPQLLEVIHYAGAAFLAWLGVMSLYRAFRWPDGGITLTIDLENAPPRSHAGAYAGDGLAINLLSPVIISFYLSVVPTFIPAGGSRWYYSLLAATHVGLAMMCHSMWATALDLMRRWFVAPWTRRALQAGTGLALIGLAARVLGSATPIHAQGASPVPVLAELFTSEGCNSCPPADRLLEVLLQEQPIDGVYVVPLSEHVTYWDQQGWKDPFGSQQFTARQQQYGMRFNLESIYTPQLVVDGSREAIGSDRRQVERSLREAAKTPKPELRVHVDQASGAITASASGAALQIEKNAELFFALTEDRLSVSVTRGENADQVLRHSGVVRVLQSAGAVDVSSHKVIFTLSPEWQRDNLRVVAFVQSKKDRRIVGIGARSLHP